MELHLDHAIVLSHDRIAAARQLATLLGVPWEETAHGHFSPVYVNEGLTLDFAGAEGDFPEQHFCFRVDDEAFEAIFGRIQAAGLRYRSRPRGAWDLQINTWAGGRNLYWGEPDGHSWEILTVSYARQRP